MAWDWGAIAGAAASIYAADRAADAAKEGGRASAAGAQAGNEAIMAMFNQTRQDNMPFLQAGYAGLNEYMNLLGMGGQAPQGAGGTGPQTQGWRVGQVTSKPTQWFGDGHSVNSSLYQSDPLYRQAWDEVAAHHQRQFGRGYTGDSDKGKLQAHMSAVYDNLLAKQQKAAPKQTATNKTPQQLQQEAFAKFRSTPGYQFGLDQGQKTIETSGAARGGLFSGATAKALQRFGNDYADQQGFTPYMNRLASLAGIGQTTANTIGGYGQNAANNVATGLQNAGNARASGLIGAGNAWQQGLGNAAYFGGQAYDSWRNG